MIRETGSHTEEITQEHKQSSRSKARALAFLHQHGGAFNRACAAYAP